MPKSTLQFGNNIDSRGLEPARVYIPIVQVLYRHRQFDPSLERRRYLHSEVPEIEMCVCGRGDLVDKGGHGLFRVQSSMGDVLIQCGPLLLDIVVRTWLNYLPHLASLTARGAPLVMVLAEPQLHLIKAKPTYGSCLAVRVQCRSSTD